MSEQWTPSDLKAFHKRELALTKSQTVARRMFIGVMLILCALAAWGIWGSK